MLGVQYRARRGKERGHGVAGRALKRRLDPPSGEWRKRTTKWRGPSTRRARAQPKPPGARSRVPRDEPPSASSPVNPRTVGVERPWNSDDRIELKGAVHMS